MSEQKFRVVINKINCTCARDARGPDVFGKVESHKQNRPRRRRIIHTKHRNHVAHKLPFLRGEVPRCRLARHGQRPTGR